MVPMLTTRLNETSSCKIFRAKLCSGFYKVVRLRLTSAFFALSVYITVCLWVVLTGDPSTVVQRTWTLDRQASGSLYVSG
eukprot:COSAG01_NODE_6107_length_3846_cov_1.891113_5_plen_80_part_00